MVESGCVAAALEVSSHALKQGRTAALHFDVGVFTNLTGDHLDYHGDMESYADCKAELFRGLAPDATAIINVDDPWSERMIEACSCSVVRCSARAKSTADAVVEIVEESMAGSRLRLGSPWGDLETTTCLVGQHNAMNVLQAALSAQALGMEAAEVAEALKHCRPPPGRLEMVTAANAPFAVFVDYAHTDDALRNVLAAARPLVPAAGRLTVVFGCGGDRDRSKRPRMASVACELADRVYITSDNPRTEDPEAIVAEIMQGVPYEQRQIVSRRTDRALAIREAVASAKPGDLLIIAGKGHEDYQIVADGVGGTVKLPFDDREQARAALAEIGVPALAPAQANPAEEPLTDALEVLQLWDDPLSSLELGKS